MVGGEDASASVVKSYDLPQCLMHTYISDYMLILLKGIYGKVVKTQNTSFNIYTHFDPNNRFCKHKFWCTQLCRSCQKRSDKVRLNLQQEKMHLGPHPSYDMTWLHLEFDQWHCCRSRSQSRKDQKHMFYPLIHGYLLCPSARRFCRSNHLPYLCCRQLLPNNYKAITDSHCIVQILGWIDSDHKWNQTRIALLEGKSWCIELSLLSWQRSSESDECHRRRCEQLWLRLNPK